MIGWLRNLLAQPIDDFEDPLGAETLPTTRRRPQREWEYVPIIDMPRDMRINNIYSALQRYSPNVRFSMLMMYEMISTQLTIENGLGLKTAEEPRNVLWMTQYHLYVDIILYNKYEKKIFPECEIFYSSLQGVKMVGIEHDYVYMCAQIVWSEFMKRGFELYDEEGNLVKTRDPGSATVMGAAKADAPPPSSRLQMDPPAPREAEVPIQTKNAPSSVKPRGARPHESRPPPDNPDTETDKNK